MKNVKFIDKIGQKDLESAPSNGYPSETKIRYGLGPSNEVFRF